MTGAEIWKGSNDDYRLHSPPGSLAIIISTSGKKISNVTAAKDVEMLTHLYHYIIEIVKLLLKG